jgi:hypothetical protein
MKQAVGKSFLNAFMALQPVLDKDRAAAETASEF